MNDYNVIIGLDRDGRVCVFDRTQLKDWGLVERRIAHIVGNHECQADGTGVGAPVVAKLMESECLMMKPYVFGNESKQVLMGSLRSAIAKREITFPDGPIREELESFQYEMKGKLITYSAPSSLYDDCVCSLALAVHCKNLSIGGRIDARWIGADNGNGLARIEDHTIWSGGEDD